MERNACLLGAEYDHVRFQVLFFISLRKNYQTIPRHTDDETQIEYDQARDNCSHKVLVVLVASLAETLGTKGSHSDVTYVVL